MVQVRTPMQIEGMFGDPIAADEAYTGTPKARTGHHNDCFLASDSDFGTYDGEESRDYVASIGLYSPIGGETCAVDEGRSDCSNAPDEMRELHYSYINNDYNEDVLATWREGGCFDDITNDIGYRFVFAGARWSERVHPGGILRIDLAIHNAGYAAMFNERPVVLVLQKGNERYEARVQSSDPRHWHSGDNVFTSLFRVPAQATTGDYTLSLWLPDAAASLRDRAAYAVRFANELTVGPKGENVLTTALPIDDAAPGNVDGAAATFVEILP
jgi:hypothetical protein